ncbi:hypothetical protein Tco_0390087 [Tanacetum coccineum]
MGFLEKNYNQEGVIDEGFSKLEKANNDDDHEISEIFKIETNLFNYKTPLCEKFNEFNYLLKVDPELFTHDIQITKTYENYRNESNNELDEPWSKHGVPYEICDHICKPFHFNKGETKWPTCNLNEDGFYDGGELPRMVRVGYMTYFQDHEWNGKACYNSDVHNKEEHEDDERCKDTAHDAPVCKIRRFKMIKYSFGQDEEYVAIKECEYDYLTKTNEDAC